MLTRRLTVFGAFILTLANANPSLADGDRGPCASAGLQSTADDIVNAPDFTGFGSAVAISGDLAAVGLPDRATEEPNGPRGRVAIYSCDRSTHTWSRSATLDPEDQEQNESRFGAALALEGRRLVVGSDNAVHFFALWTDSKKSGAVQWQLVVKLSANGVDKSIVPILAYEPPYLAVTVTKVVNEELSRFIDIYAVWKGKRISRIARLQPSEDFAALALDQRTLVAGPQVFARQKKGQWRLQQVLEANPSDDAFGTGGVAIQRHTILVGSPREEIIAGDDGVSAAGAVYVFQLRRGAWEQTQRIRPDPAMFAFNGFGQTLGFAGNFAAIGAPFAIGAFQREWGPTFLYRARGDGFVFEHAFTNLIATSIDVAPRQLIAGTDVSVLGTPITRATIETLPPN